VARAAYIHVGAIFGTIHDFERVDAHSPAQRKMLAAAAAARI